MSKYINLYTDFGLKKLFGEEGNKVLLIDFLNQLLPLRHQISEISFQNVEALPDTNEERKANFTKKEQEDYEKSRLSYIGIKQVTSTAEADGVQKGAEKKEIEAVLGFYEIGVGVDNIAKALKITEEKVRQIIQTSQHKK